MKRASPVIFTGVFLTLACVALYIAGWDLMESISSRAFDAVLRQLDEPPQSDRIAVVDIDDASLEEIGQWPWPRYVMGELTRRLLEAGPSVVAYDVVFAEPDRTSPSRIEEDLRRRTGRDIALQGIPPELADHDAAFAAALGKGRVILGCAMLPCEEMVTELPPDADPDYDGGHLFARGPPGVALGAMVLQATNIIAAIPGLRAAASTAFLNTFVDPDNIVRSTPLVWGFGPSRLYPSLALEAVRLDRGVPQCLVEYDAGGLTGVRLRDLAIPCTKAGRLVIRYRRLEGGLHAGLMRAFPTYGAADVLAGRVPPQAFTNRLVFVGTSAMGLQDVKATPMTDLCSGVEIHATMADNILAGDMLSMPNYMDGVQCVAMALAGGLLTVLMARGRSWVSFLVSLALIALTVGASGVLLRRAGLVFMPAWVVLTILAVFPTLLMVKYWREETQRRRVRHMFGTMVSRDVLRYLETNPRSFALSGERVEATMFFSDVAGFTGISESLEPPRLLELINRYLTPMTEIILARRGYLDKYEGDAIMAVWGVPFRLDGHAVEACRAALEQQAQLAQLRPLLHAEFGHALNVRMGLNTGVVTAGNMGSSRRFSYTVMGDAVNLAARLEPANRDYGTAILIGEETRRAAGDAIEVRMLDRLVVKGKHRSVLIYELAAAKGALSASRRRLFDLYEEALRLHWERRWDEALDRLRAAIEQDPEDLAARRLQTRVLAYACTPPPPAWGGEVVRETKD